MITSVARSRILFYFDQKDLFHFLLFVFKEKILINFIYFDSFVTYIIDNESNVYILLLFIMAAIFDIIIFIYSLFIITLIIIFWGLIS